MIEFLRHTRDLELVIVDESSSTIRLTEEAAAVPVAGLEALHVLRKANIQSGQKVLINGAGGSIGTFAVQLAKYFGADVTAVDSTGKLDMLRSLGAEHVIDYTREDYTRTDKTYDVIFDVVGKSSFSGCVRLLRPNGRYLLGNPGLGHIVRSIMGQSDMDLAPTPMTSRGNALGSFSRSTIVFSPGPWQM